MFQNFVIFFVFLNCMWLQGQGLIFIKRYTVSSEAASWIDAGIKCQQNGTELATIESQADETRLEWVLNNTSPIKVGYGNGVWTSGRKIDNKFVWAVNGRPLTYTKWAPGQPDNYASAEDCIEVTSPTKPKDYRWNDLNCDNKLRFICQTKCWNHFG